MAIVRGPLTNLSSAVSPRLIGNSTNGSPGTVVKERQDLAGFARHSHLPRCGEKDGTSSKDFWETAPRAITG